MVATYFQVFARPWVQFPILKNKIKQYPKKENPRYAKDSKMSVSVSKDAEKRKLCALPAAISGKQC